MTLVNHPVHLARTYGRHLLAVARPEEVEIKVRDNGPYKVTGPVRLVDADGNAWELEGDRPVALCRCGQVADEAVLRQVAPRARVREL